MASPPKRSHQPFVPPSTAMPELTVKALVLAGLMAMVLGAANTYLGLKAGMTVAATFPAAVIAMAVIQMLRGSVLEENIARTGGAVGEALAAGAVFTLPAFLMGRDPLWREFTLNNYLQGTALLLIGGVLGVLFVIVLRRTFVEDPDLPFPESVACAEIVKAGQSGTSGAKLVFGSMGLAGALEFLKNGSGIPLIGEKLRGLFTVGGGPAKAGGIFPFETPGASPALIGVGYIIGPRLSCLTLAGGVFGWLFLMPLVLAFSTATPEYADLWDHVSAYLAGEQVHVDGATRTLGIEHFFGDNGAFTTIYDNSIKYVAIGAMIVAAFYTLFKMRSSLIGGIRRSFAGLGREGSVPPSAGATVDGAADAAHGDVPRHDQDPDFKKVFLWIAILTAAMFFVYLWLTKGVGISSVTTLMMLALGFLFAAVAGYLVAILGSSSNPISGLTLSTLLLTAGLLVLLGLKGTSGIIAVLGVATVVCCVAGVAGDMLQDWKVGYILGGTPWRMAVSELVGVVAAALVLVPVIFLLHNSTPIGSPALSAPQAGLMHKSAVGIVSGTLPWEFIAIGMLFALALILIQSPSPMVIAVGMYLPFYTTAAIFVGGVIRWIGDRLAARRFGDDQRAKEQVANRGILVSSGLVAGEALMGIVIAVIVATGTKFFCAPGSKAKGCLWTEPSWFHLEALGFVVILGLAVYMLALSFRGVGPATSPDPPEP